MPALVTAPLLDDATSAVVAVVALAVAALALLFAVGAQLRLTRVRRGLRLLRGHSGEGDVLEVATRHAAEVSLLRVDCWAEAPGLVAWYERQGFTRSGTFELADGWHGQVLSMRV